MAEFENMDHRLDKINATLKEYGMGSLDDAEKVCKEAGMDPLPYDIVKSVQPICFEDAAWAYTAGAAIAIKKGVKSASEAASAIGIGLQAFTTPGSVADDRKVGLGHCNLGAMLLSCSRFVATEFSFFMAVPVMFGASGYKILKFVLKTGLASITGFQWGLLLLGSVVSFVVSLFAIKFLMNYIRKHDFTAFGWYRIVLGAIVLLYFGIFA